MGEDISAGIEATLAQADTVKRTIPRIDIHQEAARAIKICAKSKQAVISMFDEVRMGKALEAADALPIVDEITTSVLRAHGVSGTSVGIG